MSRVFSPHLYYHEEFRRVRNYLNIKKKKKKIEELKLETYFYGADWKKSPKTFELFCI